MPILLYTAKTPNGLKPMIMQAETGLDLTIRKLDLSRDETKSLEFLKINRNGKIPVLVDEERKRVVVESGAILFHMAAIADRLMPKKPEDVNGTLQWVLFQAAHIGPTFGQLAHFRSADNPTALSHFGREANRLLDVLDSWLEDRTWLVDEVFGIADIMHYPWIHAGIERLGLSITDRRGLSAWYQRMGEREGVAKGMTALDTDRHS